jgi:hypothetical protein
VRGKVDQLQGDITMKRKHHDTIVAWANGESIQVLYNEVWRDEPYPTWHPEREYRVAPKPPQDRVFYVGFGFDTCGHPRSVMSSPIPIAGNRVLKITFDSETDAIKSAELVE